MSFKKSKKALSWEVLVGIILISVVLIFFVIYVPSVLKESDYKNSIVGCNLLFNSIKGKPAFFGNELNKISLNLINSIKGVCASKTFNIKNENSISSASSLVVDCYKKAGKGIDIMPASNTEDLGVCVYCGSLKSENNIDNFDELFVKEIGKKKFDFLFNKTQSINLNNQFLKNKNFLPKKINSENEVSVFYYISKPTDKDKFSSYVSNLFGKAFPTLNYLVSSSASPSFSGVVLTNQKQYRFSSDEELNKDRTDLEKKVNCNFIVPEKNFD